MEKLSYQEVKQWFWARTRMWSAFAIIVTAVVGYIYVEPFVDAVGARIGIALGVAVFAVLLGVLAAYMSLPLPWMRAGWPIAFLLNMVVCAVMAGVVALLLGVFVLSFLQDNTIYPYPESVLSAADALMKFTAGACALWGFVMGSWFAMRRDKYFVERL